MGKSNVNKVAKELDKLIDEMTKLAKQYVKADGNKKEGILKKLKSKTKDKTRLKDELESAVVKAEKDVPLQIENKINQLVSQEIKPLINEIILQSLLTESGLNASGIKQDTLKLGKELQAAGSDASEEEVQAAMMIALVDADGDIDNVDVSDVEAVANQIEESRSYTLNEAHGPVIVIEAILGILGNAALLNAIAEKVEKVTGKKMNVSKIQTKLDKRLKWIKTVTGLPAKAMEKLFAWITKKLGGGAFAQKIGGYAGTFIATAIMFIIGLYIFPSTASIILWVFSIGGLLGKGAEMIKMVKEITHAVKAEMDSSASAAAAMG